MKKIIPLLFALIALTGCTVKDYTPVLTTEFNLNAVCTTGDFSYSCKIQREGGIVSVTATSTSAKGMIITYDGTQATLTKGDLTKVLSNNEIGDYNPAFIIYQVFAYLENAESLDVEKIDDSFQYKGSIDAGSFVLAQNSDNTLDYIEILGADIKILFE